MDAPVSQEGTQATAAPEGTAEAAPSPQVPDVVTQRLDEISGRFDQFEPLLQQALAPPAEEPQEQGSYNDFVDPEGGYLLDPEGFQTFTQQEIERGIEQRLQEQVAPLQHRLDQYDQRFTAEQFEDLKYQYPQLGDEAFQATFVPQVEAAAMRYAQSLGQDQAYAQRLATNPQFVSDQYLAGLARQQAQQGVPAGDQGVHLEGGTGNPGQPEVDPKQSWLALGQGASNGPFGNVPADQL